MFLNLGQKNVSTPAPKLAGTDSFMLARVRAPALPEDKRASLYEGVVPGGLPEGCLNDRPCFTCRSQSVHPRS